MPEVTDGCFRFGFFFSFLGRIVSALGLARRLPFDPGAPVLGATDTWGIEVTVSVSTIMLCADPSDGFPRTPLGFADVLDCLEVSGGGALVAAGRRSAALLPLSLPLSFGVTVPIFDCTGLVVVGSARAGCEPARDVVLRFRFSRASPSSRGDAGGLLSWTVSNVAGVPPVARIGVRIPGCRWLSSWSGSGEASGEGG